MRNKCFFGSHIFKVRVIVKKTKAKGFSNVKEGDELHFSLNLSDTTGASNGIYTTQIRTVHYRDSKEIGLWFCSQNIFLKNIQNFKFLIVETTTNPRDLEDHLEDIERDYYKGFKHNG